MTSYNFLKGELENLSNQFSMINIAYGFDTVIDTHIVELTPESEYYSNSELDSAWLSISKRFMAFYPNEDIAFVTSDSSLKLEEVDYIFNCKKDDKVLSDLNEIFEELLNGNYITSFESFFETLPNNIILDSIMAVDVQRIQTVVYSHKSLMPSVNNSIMCNIGEQHNFNGLLLQSYSLAA